MAKGVKTGGRQKGSKNKVSVEREAEIASSGLTPLEYFLKILRDKGRQDKERFAAAVAAAPYCHPKLASTEHSGKVDAGGVTIVRLTDLVDSAPGDNAAADPEALPAPSLGGVRTRH